MQPLIHPSDSLSFDLKDPEVDVTDAQSNRLIVYTDGRQLQKSTYNNREEIAVIGAVPNLSRKKRAVGGQDEPHIRTVAGRTQVLRNSAH